MPDWRCSSHGSYLTEGLVKAVAEKRAVLFAGAEVPRFRPSLLLLSEACRTGKSQFAGFVLGRF